MTTTNAKPADHDEIQPFLDAELPIECSTDTVPPNAAAEDVVSQATTTTTTTTSSSADVQQAAAVTVDSPVVSSPVHSATECPTSLPPATVCDKATTPEAPKRHKFSSKGYTASTRRFSDTEIEIRRHCANTPAILAPSRSVSDLSELLQPKQPSAIKTSTAEIYVGRQLRDQLNTSHVRLERLRPELIAWWTRSGPLAQRATNRLFQTPVVNVARMSVQQVALKRAAIATGGRKRKLQQQQQQQQPIGPAKRRKTIRTVRNDVIVIGSTTEEDDNANDEVIETDDWTLNAVRALQANRQRFAAAMQPMIVDCDGGDGMRTATNEVVLRDDIDSDDDDDDSVVVLFCGVEPETDPLYLGDADDPEVFM